MSKAIASLLLESLLLIPLILLMLLIVAHLFDAILLERVQALQQQQLNLPGARFDRTDRKHYIYVKR